MADQSLLAVSDGVTEHGGTSHHANPRVAEARRLETWPAILMLASVGIVFLAQIIMFSKAQGLGRWDFCLSLIPASIKMGLGLCLSVGAGIIFGWCNRRMSQSTHDSGSPSIRNDASERTPTPPWAIVGVIALVLACLGCFLSLQLMYHLYGDTFSVRLLWGASVLVFISAIVCVRAAEKTKPARNPAPLFSSRHVLALVIVVALGLILRVYDLSNLPFAVNQDNALAALHAAENLGDRGWRIVGIGEFGLPQISFSLLAISQHIFGHTPFGLRIVEALLGTLLPLGGYLFAWRAFGSHRTGLLVAALMACHAGLIHFSRHIMNIDPWFFATFGFTLLIHGALSRRVWAFGLAGLLLGFGSELYLSARILFMIVPVFMVYVLCRCRLPIRTFIFASGLLALGWVVSWGANLADMYLHANHWVMSNRTQSSLLHKPILTHVAEELHVTTISEVFLRQLERTFLSFQILQDASTQFPAEKPLFDQYVAPFIWLGLGMCCFSWRRNAGLCLALIVVVITLFFGEILQLNGPYWPRIISVMVMGSVLIAVAIESSIAAFSRVLQAVLPEGAGETPKVQRLCRVLVSGGLVSLCGMVGVREWTSWYTAARQSYNQVDVAARAIESLPQSTRICGLRGVQDVHLARLEIRFFAGARPLVELAPLSPEEAIERCGPEPFAWIVTHDQEHLRDLLIKRYPRGKVDAYSSRQDGRLLFWVFSVD